MNTQQRTFWWRWIAANAGAELIGLGGVALVGFLLFGHAQEPHGLEAALVFAGVFVVCGAFEGAVVGIAQRAVLRTLLPSVRGWVWATIAGAMAAWALGMIPSTIAALSDPAASGPAVEPALPLVLLLAGGLGALAGPLLAAFQWLSLRQVLPGGAGWWLPANAAAWALGMPLIFLGAQANEITSSAVLVGLAVAAALLAAGAVVGAVHGRVLLRLVARPGTTRPASGDEVAPNATRRAATRPSS